MVTRLHTTSGSRDIEFEPFSAILAILRLAQRLVMSTRFFSLTLDPFYRFISGRQLINDFPTGPPARAWSIHINHIWIIFKVKLAIISGEIGPSLGHNKI